MMASSLKYYILSLTLSALIAGVESQTTCTSSSHDCCWVVQIWQKMGKTTTAKSTDNSCCSKTIKGVTCDSAKSKVIEIEWDNLGLKGNIPPEIGNLTNLTSLWIEANQLSGEIPVEVGKLVNLERMLCLSRNGLSGPLPQGIENMTNLKELWMGTNQLSGPIPAGIVNLKKLEIILRSNRFTGTIPPLIGTMPSLKTLYLRNNSNLTGNLNLKCGLKTDALETTINLCGCGASTSLASGFLPYNTSDECLASGTVWTALKKRTPVFSYPVNGFVYSCNKDNEENPYQDCLNALTHFCNPDKYSAQACKEKVDEMFNQLNIFYRDLRVKCGCWRFNTPRPLSFLKNCDEAATKLQRFASYYDLDRKRIAVPKALIDSAKKYLWDNPSLTSSCT